MVDLETLGVRAGAPILSIGAVVFNPVKKLLKNVPKKKIFYQNIEIKTSIAAGFKPEPETVAWWKKQPEESRALLMTDKITVQKALLNFRIFCIAHKVECIWGRPASFDVALLEEAYRRIEMRFPWKHSKARDVQTVLDLVGMKVDETQGKKHYALDDAINQVRTLQAAYKIIKGGRA